MKPHPDPVGGLQQAVFERVDQVYEISVGTLVGEQLLIRAAAGRQKGNDRPAVGCGVSVDVFDLGRKGIPRGRGLGKRQNEVGIQHLEKLSHGLVERVEDLFGPGLETGLEKHLHRPVAIGCFLLDFFNGGHQRGVKGLKAVCSDIAVADHRRHQQQQQADQNKDPDQPSGRGHTG